MDLEELEKVLKKLKEETKDMTDFERETYYRANLMSEMSTAIIEDSVKKSYIQCVRKMKNIGMSEIEAQIHCANMLKKDNNPNPNHNLQLMYGTDDEEVIEDGKPSNECVSRKIKIFHEEHPEWEHDQVVAAAYSYCRKHGKSDALNITEQVGKVAGTEKGHEWGRVRSISLTKFSTLLRIIKNKIPLKVGHMAQGTMQPILPMKNFNKLQTKLEKLFTEESKYLTAEEQARRAQYAKFIRKDSVIPSKWEDATEVIGKEMYDFVQTVQDKSDDEKEQLLFDYLTNPTLVEEGWVNSEVGVGKANTGMNNIIKAPIILAVEMVQKYKFKDVNGEEREEYHFKPYEELKDSIRGLDKLFMILEHADEWEMGDTLGCVRDLRADPKIELEDGSVVRGIRGMGYFVESKLPVVVLDALRNEKTISVSIGFVADLASGGTFNGQKYDFTQRNIILDHLAICVDSIPRCPEDKCGVNVKEKMMTDGENFTLKYKPNYYYDIKDLYTTDSKDESSLTNIKEENISTGDGMEDSFPDEKSGLTAGGETPDFEAFLSGLRKFMGGVTDPDEKATLRRRILRTIELTDAGKTESEEEKGEQEMDEKEFQDAIAAKDAEIENLKKKNAELIEEKRQDKIKEIRSLSDAYTEDELGGKNLEQLSLLADAVSRFKPSEVKPPVVPIAPKSEELKKEVEDSDVTREKPSEIFANISKDFNLGNVR